MINIQIILFETNQIKKLEKLSWYPISSITKFNLPEEYINVQFELKLYIDDIKVYNNMVGN